MRDLFSLLLPWPIGEQTIVWLASRQSRTVLLPVPTPLGREVCCGRSLSPPPFFFSLFSQVASRHHREEDEPEQDGEFPFRELDDARPIRASNGSI